MPTKSLHSSAMKWPNAQIVHKAVVRWAEAAVHQHSGVAKVGCFGSYARRDWGVGSDIDLLVVVHHSDVPFQRRPLEWDTLTLPVPADLLVYTQREWDSLEGRFRDTLDQEAVWVYGNH